MKHIRQIRKTYARQLGLNDCGVACLCMILKFNGNLKEADLLRNSLTSYDQNLSLLELRNMALTADVPARCVRMEIAFLAENTKPCILHLNDNTDGSHFQVCYGSEYGRAGRRYLMGDPARGIHYISEEALGQIWVSRAALYFDSLVSKPAKQANSSWHLLLTAQLIPKGLLMSIPLLHVFTAILGIAWSWALQRGINSSIAGKEGHLIAGMIVLLLIVTIAKNLFSYVRQQLMVRLNSTINKHLMYNLIQDVLIRKRKGGTDDGHNYLKNSVSNMMKMQQAVSAFLATILSEGALVVLVIAALCYQSPIAGLINVGYLLIIAFCAFQTFPRLLFDHAHLNELSGLTEKMILQDIQIPAEIKTSGEQERAFEFHAENHYRYLVFAESVSSRISKNSLVQECLGTLNVISVFIYGIMRLRDESLDYSAFMIVVILSYIVTAMMPKVCSSLFIMSEGIEASRDYKITSAV
jgi:ABC-type bacteriocin/lantibiotic exporter with double-glycine peptidase domain